MTCVSDSIIFRNIFSTSEISEIWSDRTRTQYYLDFEAKLALVQGRCGMIPQDAADVIQTKCNVNLMNMHDLQEDTTAIGVPVFPVVKQLVRLANETNQGFGEWAHWGATSQDVMDTATVLQLRDTCKLVEGVLDRLIDILRHLSLKYAETPMAARSMLQHAVPITFGFKMARLLATFQRHKQRLTEILPRLLVLEFGGAAGTLATIAETGMAFRVQDDLANELGLLPPEIAWHTERDRIAEIGAFFALVTGTCAKFALDTKLMMQTEVAEVSEPYVPHRGSSSTMPQKRNPISCVSITAMTSTVKQLSAALFEAVVEDHERSSGPWQLEWIVLPQISTLTYATLQHTLTLLQGMEVHPDAMKVNLDRTNGAIVSEAVMMSLGKKIGRQVAHDLVYDICIQLARARGSAKSFIDLLMENEVVHGCGIGREELEDLCNPSNYLGLSREMVTKVVK